MRSLLGWYLIKHRVQGCTATKPSCTHRARTLSMPNLRVQSVLSEAVKLGEAFTSNSQGFSAESIRMSYPYSCTQHRHAAATDSQVC
jgi:hypothetical protein